jgi:hypothetical protein
MSDQKRCNKQESLKAECSNRWAEQIIDPQCGKVQLIAKEKGLTFSQAFEYVRRKKGFAYGMRLPLWTPNILVKAMYPTTMTSLTLPFLVGTSSRGSEPCCPNGFELFSDEWEIVEL